jgi:hypothetical protein
MNQGKEHFAFDPANEYRGDLPGSRTVRPNKRVLLSHRWRKIKWQNIEN